MHATAQQCRHLYYVGGLNVFPPLTLTILPVSHFSIDLSLPVNGSIDRNSPSWTTNLLDLYLDTINTFTKYNNMLGYNVRNEVVIQPNGTDAATFMKAAARDVKAYLLLRAHRSTRVGWTSLLVSKGTEGNSLRFAKRIALANGLERSRESTWDLSSHNTRVVAK